MVVDAGEAEAIALASELGLRLIVDDLRARRVASNMGIPIIGTVGVLILAKQSGHLEAVAPVIRSMEEHGFFVGADLKAEAYRQAGESAS
jgi:predicted nucleic acid-binding protein